MNHDLTSPNDSDGQHDRRAQAGGRKRRGPPRIPSRDECAGQLAALPGLLVTGQISPTHANSIRSVLGEILKYHRDTQAQTAAGGVPQDVLQRLQNEPGLLNLLAPLLTDEQLDWLQREEEADDAAAE